MKREKLVHKFILGFIGNTKKIFGKDAAKLLLQKQLEGIKMLTDRGILVKANSVLIPGINDKDLPNVAKKT